MSKPLNKPKRWAAAVQRAREAAESLESALSDLADVQGEYQKWLDNLPDSLQTSPTGEKLQEIADLDVEGATSSLEEIQELLQGAEDADLPQGFGRD